MVDSQPDPLFLGPETSDHRAVVLPCEPDQFRDFIAGLLGRPQTIERSIAGPFEVSKSDVENIYHLIDQRLMSQNEATLVQFTARIVYDDNSSVLLNSFFDFVSYSEVRPLKSRSIHLGWTFLVKFRNKKYPEKQQIDISFYGGFVSNNEPEFEISFGSIPRREAARYGAIQYRISHTDRTWGTDMDALLDGQLRTLVKVDLRARQVLRQQAGRIAFLSWLILLSGSLVSSIIVASNLIDRHTVDLTSFQKGPITIEQLAKEFDVAIQFLIHDPRVKYIIFAIIFNIIALACTSAFAIWIADFARGTRRSFVLLTTKAIEERDIWIRSPKNSIFRFLISVIGALIISVIGNALFYFVLRYSTE